MENRSEYKKGLFAVLGSMLLWGLLPIYWQMLIPINSWVIILYRIFTVAVYSFIVARYQYSFKEIFEPLKDRKTRITVFTAGFVVTINWSVYIYAVNSNQVVQSALGYYIEPLMIVLVGNIIFHEKFTKNVVIAILLAGIAVAVNLVHFKELPMLALALALTFSIYTAIKKSVKLPPAISLLYETMILAPIALVAIIYLELNGKGALSMATSKGQYVLMLLCGLLTLIPLGLYSYGAQRMPMFHIGLAQYLSPTIALLCGVLFLGESVDTIQILSFGLIWIGLVIFSLGEYKKYKEGMKL